MKKDILTLVSECDTCQRNKGEMVKALGPFQPFPIPPTLWIYISMEFIACLPNDGNKSVIMVVVD